MFKSTLVEVFLSDEHESEKKVCAVVWFFLRLRVPCCLTLSSVPSQHLIASCQWRSEILKNNVIRSQQLNKKGFMEQAECFSCMLGFFKLSKSINYATKKTFRLRLCLCWAAVPEKSHKYLRISNLLPTLFVPSHIFSFLLQSSSLHYRKHKS